MFAEEGGNGSGGVQQIVYRSAVPVTPDALDALCDKVHAQPCHLFFFSSSRCQAPSVPVCLS